LTHAANAPGLAWAAVAVVALVVGLYAFGTGHVLVGAVVVLLAAVSGTAGVAWLLSTHRRVRAAELRWQARNSDEPTPPPSS
jgi:multisubunit Na+/H+ antiporter MnhB subunit